jgi:mono/diheme cytochrome c family protein
MRHLLLLVALAAAFAISCGGKDDSTPALPPQGLNLNVQALAPEEVALGKAVYDQDCAPCHGINGEGQPNWRQRLPDGGLPPPPHDGTGHTWHHGDGQLYDIVRNGGLSGMPAWGAKLSHEEIRAVLTYIKTFWGARERAYQEAASHADPFPSATAVE